MTSNTHTWTTEGTTTLQNGRGTVTRERCATCNARRVGPFYPENGRALHDFTAPDGTPLGSAEPTCVAATRETATAGPADGATAAPAIERADAQPETASAATDTTHDGGERP